MKQRVCSEIGHHLYVSVTTLVTSARNMLMNTLKDNIRLLESLTIKSTIPDVAGVPGSPEHLFLICKITAAVAAVQRHSTVKTIE